MTLSEETLRKISEYAIHKDWDLAFEGRSRGNRHLFRVNKLGLYLNEIEGGERDIVIAGAWLHDIGLVEGNKGHCFKGGKIAERFLAELELDMDTIKKIVHCVEAHDGEIKANSVEAKIVHDSDTVDKMGPLGLIRHTWKMANVDYHDYTVNELLEFLPEHLTERRSNLYLDSANSIVKRYEPAVEEFFADEDLARKVLNEVFGQAREGIPTEAVVTKLQTEDWMKRDFAKVLEEQLLLAFL